MRIGILCLMTVLFSATINCAGAAEDLTGNWVFSTAPGGPKPVCTITQKGQNISGKCKGPTNDGPVTGTVRGNKVALAWAGSTIGVDKRFDFTGQLDAKAGTITGKVTWTILQLAGPDTVTAQPPPAPLDFIATKISAAAK